MSSAPTVSSLLEQRRRGDISKEEFFESLATLSKNEPPPRLLPSPGEVQNVLTAPEADRILRDRYGRSNQKHVSYTMAPSMMAATFSGASMRDADRLNRTRGSTLAVEMSREYTDYSEKGMISEPNRGARSSVFKPPERFTGASADLTKMAQEHAMDLADQDLVVSSLPDEYKFNPRSFTTASLRNRQSPIDRYMGRDQNRNLEPDKEFYDRNRVWEEQKSMNLEEIQRSLDEERMKECTFQPQLRASQKSVKRQPKSLVHRQEALNKRLSVRQSTAQWEQRRPLVEVELTEKEMAGCTFQPDISISQSRVPSKIADMRLLDKSHDDDLPVERSMFSQISAISAVPQEEIPTFRPDVNKVPANFTIAREYLSKDVFDRLTSPPRGRKDGAGDDESLRQSRDQLRNSRGEGGASASDISFVTGSSQPDAFVDFLWRQNEHEFVRLQRLREIEDEIAYPHRPQVPARSREIANRSFQGTGFHERMSRDIYDRSDKQAHMAEASMMPMEGVTFQPQITRRGSMMKSRSMAEMSLGDLQEKRKKAEELRKKLETYDSETFTFKPETNSSMRQFEGIETRTPWNSGQYLENLQKKRQREEAKRKRIQDEKIQREMNECTFKPQINDAPEYVSGIAASSRLYKKAKQKEARLLKQKQQQKPEWRM